ncbi:MAG TPA: hypothetical protein K8V44_09800 [Staphylococcus saprophyticus]|nr:hypothetical protein [Staphylococcus saprophyticus]
MENSEKEKLTTDRLNRIEKRIDGHDAKIDAVEDKLDIIDDKHDARYLEQIKVTTELQGTSRMTMEATNRMADSIEGLVSELKDSNARTDTRFNQITEEVREVRTKIDKHEDARNLKLEEKKLSNRTLGFIIAGGFAVMQVIVQVIAPLLFG